VDGARRGWRVLGVLQAFEVVFGAVFGVVEIRGPNRAGASFRRSEVGGIAFDPQDHVASDAADSGDRMGGAVVEKLDDSLHCGLGAFGLLGGDGADSSKHRGINCASIKEEGAEDFLHSFGVSGI
jgi:hypothetical protein